MNVCRYCKLLESKYHFNFFKNYSCESCSDFYFICPTCNIDKETKIKYCNSCLLNYKLNSIL